MVQMQFIIILIVDMLSVIVAGIVADIGYTTIQGSTIHLHYMGALLAAALFVFLFFLFLKFTAYMDIA
jgi:hypothetical protein